MTEPWWDDLSEYPSPLDVKRLRADATDLLVALKGALIALQRGERISYEEYVLATDAAEAAIAKAEGKS